MDVRVSIVGPVAIEIDGVAVDSAALGARRTRLLLVALATSRDGLTSRELAERIWSTPPSTWGASLRGAIATLRTGLEPSGLGGQALVQTTATGWALAGAVEIDLEHAATLVERAESEDADAEAALRAAESAVTELTGDVLSGEELDWIEVLRDRRASLLLRAQASLADVSLALGRFTAAIGIAETVLLADPLDERAHRRLIRALAGAGDRAGAIRAFERCRATLVDELGVDPSPETAEIYLEILRSGSGPSGSLPLRPPNGFIGRGDELERLSRALAESRVVTLVGRGGVGKSRLALEAAASRDLDAPGGRYWVALGDLALPGLVASAIAAAVGAESAADPVAASVTVLAPAGPALLVLDGCERHSDHLVEIVHELVAGAPELKILATSRARLGVDGERRVDVVPLGTVPDSTPGGAVSEAEILLRDRVSARGVDDLLVGADPELIRTLCDLCEGMPVALELAAAQLETVAVADLVDALADSRSGAVEVLDLLLDQSYAALDDAETAVFRAAAILDGSLPLALVRGLVSDRIAGGRIARLLSTLGESGLVVVDRSTTRWRYGVDDHVRAFARSRTDEAESIGALQGLLEAIESVPPAEATAQPGPFRDAIIAAGDGFRGVFAAATDGRLDRERALGLAFRMHRHWAATGVAEGRFWLRRLLQDAPPSPTAALARFAAGYLAYWAGDTVEGLPLLRAAAVELGPDHPGFAARALIYAAGLSDDVDEPDRALAEIRESVVLAQREGGGLLASAEMSVASILAERGDRAAVDAADRATSLIGPEAPAPQLHAMHATAALVAWRVGDIPSATRFSAGGAPLFTAGPSISRMVLAMAASGVALQTGDPERAAELAELAVGDGEELGVDRELPLACALVAHSALALGRLDDARTAALRGVDAASRLDTAAPGAVALEAAAAVAAAMGTGEVETGPVMAAASAIRRKGQRPIPPGLAPGFDGALVTSDAATASTLELPDAFIRARSLLT